MPQLTIHLMDRLPNELRARILRHLRKASDRDALVEAFPDWKDLVDRENKFRCLEMRGWETNKFYDLFVGPSIRRRRTLQEVELRLDQSKQRHPEFNCCAAGHRGYGTVDNLETQMVSSLDWLNYIAERFERETHEPCPHIRLKLVGKKDWDPSLTCTGTERHEARQVLMSQLYRNTFHLFPYYQVRAVRAVRAVDEFMFVDGDSYSHVSPTILMDLIESIADLRVIELEFTEKVMWFRRYKDDWHDGTLINPQNRTTHLENRSEVYDLLTSFDLFPEMPSHPRERCLNSNKAAS
ncbi:hypothetical protein VTJ49DRAFT_1040 [Mycothermus thermophilus]|uniref:F-box domain-containing protein n=1 Tax=Humicola insolens TaxID=85995 RepID=A0ABR3VE51_HUMIN